MKPELKAAMSAWVLAVCFMAGGRTLVGAQPTPSEPVASSPESAAAKSAGPKLQFAEPVFEFGKVAGGEAVKHEFVFTNAGDRLLIITDIKPSCGCTTAGNGSRNTQPGERGVIPIELHTANLSGAVEKTVTVTCNDPVQPHVTLRIKGTVWHPIEVTPPSVMLSGLLDSSSNQWSLVSIINHEEAPLTLSEPISNHKSIAAEVRTNQPGKEYQLAVKLVPPLGSGNVFGRVTMKTSSAKMPVLNVDVWAVAQPAVMALPAQLNLPAGPLLNGLTQSVSIRSLWANPLVLSEPAINVRGVDLQIKELQPGRFFTLLLAFPKGFELAPTEKAELSVKSNHPQFPVIRVPVVQRPRPVGSVTPGPSAAGAAVPSAPSSRPASQHP